MADKSIKLKKTLIGRPGWRSGSIQQADADEAQRLVDNGIADYVEVKKRTRRRSTKKASEER